MDGRRSGRRRDGRCWPGWSRCPSGCPATAAARSGGTCWPGSPWPPWPCPRPGELAGLTPVDGLYTLLLPAVAYTVLGSSRQLIIGPEGSIAAMVAAAVIPLAAGDPRRAATLASLLALLVGAVYLVARLIRLGWVADYFSPAVLLGYLHGVAVVLVIGQLGKRAGDHPEAEGPLPTLADGVTQGFPIGASGARTAVNDQMGRAASCRACSPPGSSPSSCCS